MPRAKTTNDDLLLKVLRKYTFTSILKSALKAGDRFISQFKGLQTVTSRGTRGTLVALSYEGDTNLEILETDGPPATHNIVTLVQDRVPAKRNPVNAPISGVAHSYPEPAASSKKGVAVIPE